MPRNLVPQQFAASYSVTNDVTQSLGVDPNKYLQDFPDIVPDVFSGITYFIGLIDQAMGWTIPSTSSDSGIPDALVSLEQLLDGFNLTGPNSFLTQINNSAIAQDLQALGTLVNQQLGGTASTVNVFVADGVHGIKELAAAGTQSTVSMAVTNPVGVTLDPTGNMYVADHDAGVVYQLTTLGVQNTLGFTGLVTPVDVAVDDLGTVYVADSSGAVYSLTTAGVQTQLNFTGLVTPSAITVDALLNVYVADHGAAKVYQMTAGGTQTTLAFTGLTGPQGVVVDGLFNVYVSDSTHVYRLSLGTQTTMGFTGLTAPGRLAIDSAGTLYVVNGTSVITLNVFGTQDSLFFTGLLSSPAGGIAVQNAQWADIEIALQQITATSQSNWDTLLSELGLSSVSGSGDDTFTAFLQALSGDWTALLADLGLSSVSGGGDSSFSTYISTLESDLSDLFSGTDTDSGTALADFLNDLLGPGSPLDASNLFNSINPSLLSMVPVASIGVGTPNFLNNPGFDTSASVVDQGMQGWSWNGTTGHTNNGCAQIVANGTWKTLESNACPVSSGETMPLSIWTQYVSASSTNPSSNDIQLNARAYLANAGGNLQLVSTTLLQAIQSPSGNSSNSGENNFLELTGTYTVPSGVDHVSMQLAVSPNVTGGTVRFDDGVLSVSGLLPQNLVQGLSALQADFTANGTAWATFLQAGLTAIESYTSWSTFISSLDSAWTTYTTTTSALTSAEIFTIQQILNTALGINTSTGQMAASNVANALGGSSLAADVQGILDFIANGLGHSGTGHTLTNIETYLGIIPPANVGNALGTATLASDVQAILDFVANGLGHSGTGHTLSQVESYFGIIPAGNVANALGTSNLATDVQAILDNIANALGHSGTGHTLTNIETYLGLIPPANVTNALGTASLATDIQAILDFVANGLGHSGTGHTLTQIESYFGIIPAANVANVLGGSNLGADVASVNTANTTQNNWWTQLLSELGLSGGSGTGTNIGSALSTTASTASSAASTASSAASTATGAANNWSTLLTGLGASLVSDLAAAGTWLTDFIPNITAGFGNGQSSDLQTVADGINTAVNGGNATGTPVSSVVDNLQSLPQENIAINTAAGATTVSVDTATAQLASSSSLTINSGVVHNYTVTHTPISQNANYILAAYTFVTNFGWTPQTISATITGSGGPTLYPALLKTFWSSNNGNVIVLVGIPIPSGPSGVAANGNGVQIVLGMGTNTNGNVISTACIQTMSVIGWNSTSLATLSPDGQHSNPSQSIPSIVSGELVVEVLTQWSTSSCALSSYNQTVQENSGVMHDGTVFAASILGTSTNTGTVTFSATSANTSANLWNSLLIILKPSPGALQGSGIRQYRSLGTSSGGSGQNLFPSGFFDTTVSGQQSADMAVSNNAITITLAGWYMVEITALLSAFSASLGMVTLSALLYKNSSVDQILPGISAAFNVVGAQDFTPHMGGSGFVYCNIGDILQPGYVVDGAGTMSTLTFTGSATQTFWGVTLCNRSLL